MRQAVEASEGPYSESRTQGSRVGPFRTSIREQDSTPQVVKVICSIAVVPGFQKLFLMAGVQEAQLDRLMRLVMFRCRWIDR